VSTSSPWLPASTTPPPSPTRAASTLGAATTRASWVST